MHRLYTFESQARNNAFNSILFTCNKNRHLAGHHIHFNTVHLQNTLNHVSLSALTTSNKRKKRNENENKQNYSSIHYVQRLYLAKGCLVWCIIAASDIFVVLHVHDHRNFGHKFGCSNLTFPIAVFGMESRK